MKKILYSCLSAVLLFASSAFGPAPAPAGAAAETPLKIGFICVGPVGEAGWTYSHDQARRQLSRDPANATFLAESVPVSEAKDVIRTMAANGCRIIITTSYSFKQVTEEAAEEHPDITFLNCSDHTDSGRMSAYLGRVYQARYLSGMVAGGMTKSGVIGYVAAQPIPEVIRGINAFALGVREVNPAAEVRVLWTKSWYDPVLESETAMALIDGGADVIAQHQDSPAPQEAAQERGVWSVGYNSDMSRFAPDAHLVAAVWHWASFYQDVAAQVRRGTWKPGNYWPGMESGIVDISPFGPMVPEALRARVLARKQEIISGGCRVFGGPVLDAEGAERVAPGAVPADAELLGMDWFVQGVSVADTPAQ